MTRMTAASRTGATALVLALAAACTSTAATPQPHASPTPHRSATTPPPAAIGPPVSHGTLRVTGPLRDGLPVRAAGLSWRPSPLPPGTRLLSFEVGYVWQACTARSGGTGRHCSAGSGCHGDAVRRAALCNRARRHREVPQAHRDRRRGRRDRPRHLHVPRHPLVTQLHGAAPGPALPLCPQARGRVPERAARAAHRLQPGVLPGEPAALQRGERPGVAELPG